MQQALLDFWFQEIQPAQWWKVDTAFDEQVRARFGALHEQARRCELFAWRATAEGRLAEVIALDQFARNIHRGTPRAFSADPLALALAQEAVAAGDDLKLAPERRAFFYMPYMHSESPVIHAVAEPLMKLRAPQGTYDFEIRHRAIVDRFGRYPHRNVILCRASTHEELEFLKQPGSSF